MRRLLATFLLVFITWIVLTHTLSLQIIIAGLVISIAISFITRHLLSKDTPKIVLHPRRWVAFFVYFLVLIKEGFIAHIDVMKRIFTGKVRPAIVSVPVEFKTSLSKTMFANSVTLTPGTLTVNVEHRDHFYIHTIGYRKNKEIGTSFKKYSRRVIK